MSLDFHLTGVSFRYGQTPVLREVSLRIAAGECTAIVGPNGAGKSTLLRILAGLIRHYTGSARFSGGELARSRPGEIAKRIAFVPQETHMQFPFTVGEVV